MTTPPTPPAAVAARVLRVAAVMADDDELDSLDTQTRRWHEGRLRLVVAGEAKRGKSTLVNALLGRAILPTGVTPVTSVATTVTAVGPDGLEGVGVAFLDGRTRSARVEELPDYVTESGNPVNVKGVDHVTVRLASTWLGEYPVELVDTPGTGSVFAHNTDEANAALDSLDAVIVVLSVDPPISAAERDLLRRVGEFAVRTFVVINKADRHRPDEIRESETFTEKICAESGPIPEIHVCSAISGPQDPGFAGFRQAVLGYVSDHATTDATRALTGHTHRALEAMLDIRRVRRRALQMADEGHRRALTTLGTRLGVIREQRQDLRARVGGQLRQLRSALDSHADDAITHIGGACAKAFDDAWPQLLEGTPLVHLEEAGRRLIEDEITAHVESWRGEQAAWLEQQLARLVEHTATDLTAQVELATAAVGEALSISLTAPEARPELALATAFWYDFSHGSTWEPPLRGTAERIRSHAARQRRIRRRLDESLEALVDRQVGRARADLQARLEKAGRSLRKELEAYLDHTVGRLEAAVDHAANTPSGHDPSRPEQIAQLTTQILQLERALHDLSETSWP